MPPKKTARSSTALYDEDDDADQPTAPSRRRLNTEAPLPDSSSHRVLGCLNATPMPASRGLSSSKGQSISPLVQPAATAEVQAKEQSFICALYALLDTDDASRLIDAAGLARDKSMQPDAVKKTNSAFHSAICKGLRDDYELKMAILKSAQEDYGCFLRSQQGSSVETPVQPLSSASETPKRIAFAHPIDTNLSPGAMTTAKQSSSVKPKPANVPTKLPSAVTQSIVKIKNEPAAVAPKEDLKDIILNIQRDGQKPLILKQASFATLEPGVAIDTAMMDVGMHVVVKEILPREVRELRERSELAKVRICDSAFAREMFKPILDSSTKSANYVYDPAIFDSDFTVMPVTINKGLPMLLVICNAYKAIEGAIKKQLEKKIKATQLKEDEEEDEESDQSGVKDEATDEDEEMEEPGTPKTEDLLVPLVNQPVAILFDPNHDKVKNKHQEIFERVRDVIFGAGTDKYPGAVKTIDDVEIDHFSVVGLRLKNDADSVVFLWHNLKVFFTNPEHMFGPVFRAKDHDHPGRKEEEVESMRSEMKLKVVAKQKAEKRKARALIMKTARESHR